MEKKFSQIDEKGARSRKTKDGHVVDNYKLPDKDGGHSEIIHKGKTFVSSGKSGTDIRNRNAPAHHYVAKEKIDDPKSKYHGQEVEKGIWVNQLGRVIEEDMQKFSEIVAEETIHLAPHGNTGQHYRVVKGVHTLKAGEILHDSEVDDLHDMGYKVKHLKEDEQVDEAVRAPHVPSHIRRKSAQLNAKNAAAPTASERYQHHLNHIVQLHKDLGKQLKHMTKAAPSLKVDWGHVGSMEETHRRLREIVHPEM